MAMTNEEADYVLDDHPDRDYYCEGCDEHFPRSEGLTYPPDPRIWCPQCSDACEPYYEEQPGDRAGG
jgi:hypothetical protein